MKTNVLLFLYGGFILFFFALVVLRLFQLTIVKGVYYNRLSEENRIRELMIEPKRGSILDRKGVTLAESLPANTKSNTPRLSSTRSYLDPEETAHVVGYRQKASQSDIREDNCVNKLKLGDKVGKKGIEKMFECDLRGKQGKKLIEVDSTGRYIRTLGISFPVDGSTMQIALDYNLQKKAYEAMKGKKGAVIASVPATGEILALVSTPSFDIQNFEDEKSAETGNYLKNSAHPLFNRGTEAAYPPGSIFKLVVAAGALEEKRITDATLVEDTGVIQAGPITFGNWYFLQYGKTEGSVDIVKAIRRSNDIFFYKTGEALGVEGIKKWADSFGYGQQTGIGFEEAEGLIPSPFWKEEILKDRWYLGDTYNLSIGQGYLLVTPLQVAAATSAFANGGYVCKPELLKAESGKSKVENCRKLPISEKTLKLIREGMKQACSPGGTGWPLFEFKVKSEKLKVDNANHDATASANFRQIQTACKTGTAESHAESGEPHAWFTVFAPYEKPEIAVTVLVEEGGQGADVAAPIAKDILSAFFQRN